MSDAGKARSRRNSLKHGLTGAGIVLPHENQEAVEATFNALDDDLRPVGALEAILVKRIALTSTRLDRLARQECGVLSRKSREAIGAYDREVQNNVEQLGIRLLNDPVPRAGGDAVLPSRDHPIIRKWQKDEPIIMVMELKETVQGCDYLIARWKELEFMLANEGFWHFDSKFKAIRMLGKRFETMLDDVLVGDIFANCHALLPELQEKWVLMCQHAAYLAENRPTYHVRLTKLAERIPEDKLDALDFLHGIVAREIEALEARREELIPVCELNRSEAPLRSAIDDTKQGELRRRYETANERELHKCIDDLVKVRKMPRHETAGEVDSPVIAPDPELQQSTEVVLEEKVAPDTGEPTRWLRNEPEHSVGVSPIRPGEDPDSSDSRSGWVELAP